MKIKTKKQLNLPQLIEWGFDNPELSKGKLYNIDDEDARFSPYVSFPADGTGVRVPCTITQDNTFTVEEEIEIDEYTVFHTLVKVIEDGTVYTCTDAIINREKNSAVVEIHAILNGVLKLIWTREKGLVE